ncbi:TIR domain-containing protein [Streptomyces sp. NPDC006422]|uniref:TIR domain-containing protein n=1 Tax=unclassified Streptomyces TaxID=2593676 RepID=UPI0033ABEC12
MPKIFINYRSGDGDQLAGALDQALTHRFGEDHIFKDGNSIRAGDHYPDELLHAVRTCSVLLAVIGPYWTATPDLRREDDWVRKELLEARKCGIHVVPVLDATAVQRLEPDELPAELAWLAALQALPYAPYRGRTDLEHIGNELAELIPDLGAVSSSDKRQGRPETHNEVSGSTIQGSAFQGRDFNGDVAQTMYKGNQGVFHSGRGNQQIHQNFTDPEPDEDASR